MTFIPIEQVMGLYDKVKGAQTLRFCPVCRGSGEFDVPSNMGPSVPKCAVCKGVGLVDLASICVCGMPAVFFKEEHIFCGREACLTALKHRHSGLGA